MSTTLTVTEEATICWNTMHSTNKLPGVLLCILESCWKASLATTHASTLICWSILALVSPSTATPLFIKSPWDLLIWLDIRPFDFFCTPYRIPKVSRVTLDYYVKRTHTTTIQHSRKQNRQLDIVHFITHGAIIIMPVYAMISILVSSQPTDCNRKNDE